MDIKILRDFANLQDFILGCVFRNIDHPLLQSSFYPEGYKILKKLEEAKEWEAYSFAIGITEDLNYIQIWYEGFCLGHIDLDFWEDIKMEDL